MGSYEVQNVTRKHDLSPGNLNSVGSDMARDFNDDVFARSLDKLFYAGENGVLGNVISSVLKVHNVSMDSIPLRYDKPLSMWTVQKSGPWRCY